MHTNTHEPTDDQLLYDLAELLCESPDLRQLAGELDGNVEEHALDAAAGILGAGREYALEQLARLRNEAARRGS
jgi:hypothetical protein